MKKSNSNIPLKKTNYASKEEEYRKINNDLEVRKLEVLKATKNSLNQNNILNDSTSLIKNNWNMEQDSNEFDENSDLQPTSSLLPMSKSKYSVNIRNKTPQNLSSLKKSSSSLIFFNEDFNNDLQNYDDIMPPEANEMSDEAQIRFLKASLKAMKQDVDYLAKENRAKDESLRDLQNKYKEADDIRQRLQKSSSSQNSLVDKLRKQVEEYKEQITNLEVQLQGLRKESESLQKSEKINQTTKGSIEVKLNKALEECEKYKSQMEKLKMNKKDFEMIDKQRIDELTLENKRLEKQKNELLNAYKKQMKLIDVYKRLQMHMEASRLLSFTEDEFMRALELNTADIDDEK